MKEITIVILDDSLFFRESIQKKLEQDINIKIIGKASNPYMARDFIQEHQPDILISDVFLGSMSGIEFVQQLLPQYYLPVIMISSDSQQRVPALSNNIVDFICKPVSFEGKDGQAFFDQLLLAIKKVVFNRKDHFSFEVLTNQLVTIGASTGGSDAVEEVLKRFPPIMPPIVIAQHMSEKFTGAYAKRLNRNCSLSIKEANDGEILLHSNVYIAKGGMNIEIVERRGLKYIHLIDPNDKDKAIPNINILFESVAKCYGKRAVGILLTGMGKDGANGLKQMRDKGASTIAQDEGTSVVYGMPRVAKEIGAAKTVLPIQKISNKCCDVLKG